MELVRVSSVWNWVQQFSEPYRNTVFELTEQVSDNNVKSFQEKALQEINDKVFDISP